MSSALRCIRKEEFLMRNTYRQREDICGCCGRCENYCPVYPTPVKAGICGFGGVDVHRDLDAYYDGNDLQKWKLACAVAGSLSWYVKG